VKSCDAYFVTYTRRGKQVVKNPTVPPHILQIVKQKTEEWMQDVNDSVKRRSELEAEYNEHLKKFHEILPILAVKNEVLSFWFFGVSK
jgi:hypothetical protein